MDYQIRKELNEFFKEAKLCGAKNPKLCYSHSVPLLVLKNICENKGTVEYYLSIIKSGIEKKELGLRQVGCFRIICTNCDSQIFKEYENEDILLKFLEPQKIMRAIALKNVLKNTYGQWDQFFIFIHLLEQYQLNPCEEKEIQGYLGDSLRDLEYYRREMIRIEDMMDGDNLSKFKILYKQLLPYKVPIAFQGCFAINDGNSHKDSYNIESGAFLLDNDFISLLHIAVFPLSNDSLVLMFAVEEDLIDNDFWRMFNAMNDTDKLKIINLLILKYSDNYFVSNKISLDLFQPDFINICRQPLFFVPSQLSEEYILKEMNICPNFLEMDLENL